MIRVKVLGSGSKGNATLVECGELRLLIDIGFSAKSLTQKLERAGLSPDSLSAILLTHAHADHVKGLATFCKKWPIPVYATRLLCEGWDKRPAGIAWRYFESGQTFLLGEVTIASFRVPHDSTDPVGYRISYKEKSYGHLTDTGSITPQIKSALTDVHALFLESNHDPDMLRDDQKRSYQTKVRILARHGHLSNEQASRFLEEIAHPQLQWVVLGHLSSDCNTPRLARALMEHVLEENPLCAPSLYCSSQEEALDWLTICP